MAVLRSPASFIDRWDFGAEPSPQAQSSSIGTQWQQAAENSLKAAALCLSSLEGLEGVQEMDVAGCPAMDDMYSHHPA